MRVYHGAILLVCLAAAVPSGAPAQAPEAGTVLAQARQALGGEKRLSAVKSFTATGRTRQVRGENLVPIEFEIACQLPDKYIRKDEIPAQESGPTTTGFNGDQLIQLPPMALPALPGGELTPAQIETMRKTRATSAKQDFVRLTLGMFATSFAAYPLTFTYVGKAEAPQGTADVLEARGAGVFVLRFFVNSETHLPIMVSWTTGTPAPGRGGVPPPAPGTVPPSAARGAAPPPTGAAAPPGGQAPPAGQAPPGGQAPPAGRALPPGQAPPAGRDPLPPGGRVAGPGAGASPKATEYRIYYADYRDVGGGVMFPFRLRRAVAGETVEETMFDGFRVNPKIDARKFEVAK